MNFIEELLHKSPTGAREAPRAALRVAVTEGLLLALQERGISKAELARRIGMSRSAITQALSAHRNLSLNSLADMTQAAGLRVLVRFERDGLVQHGVTGHTEEPRVFARLQRETRATSGSEHVQFTS